MSQSGRALSRSKTSNTTPLPARIYANEGLCQILFFQSDEVCETSYADRKGKYQSQKGIVLPKLWGVEREIGSNQLLRKTSKA